MFPVHDLASKRHSLELESDSPAARLAPPEAAEGGESVYDALRGEHKHRLSLFLAASGTVPTVRCYSGRADAVKCDFFESKLSYCARDDPTVGVGLWV